MLDSGRASGGRDWLGVYWKENSSKDSGLNQTWLEVLTDAWICGRIGSDAFDLNPVLRLTHRARNTGAQVTKIHKKQSRSHIQFR
jgi:hypothetical protein